jgi:outer membrane protein OmpU
MKSILLTTTAIVAFAGVAAADGHTSLDFSGSATLGHNDDDSGFGEDGFYWSTNLGVSMSAALDNGVTAGVVFDIEIDDEGDGNDQGTDNDFDLMSSDLVLSLTTETLGLHFGDTSFAAESQWKSAGDMEADGFSEADGEVALRADMTYGGVSASVSYAVANNQGGYVADDGATGEAGDQLSFGASGAVGMVNFAVAYQAEADNTTYFLNNGDWTNESIMGVSAGTALAGADITVAFAQKTGLAADGDKTSMGVQVAYPFGPVTATVYYVAEDDDDVTDAEDNYGLTVAYADGPIAAKFDYDNDQGTDKWNIDGSYDTGLGLTLLAGMQNENEGDDNDYYVGGDYDLGGGANVLVVYANDEDFDQEDEIGAGEYMPGTTVAVSFKF